jgi:glutaredoxin 3
MIKIYTTSWCPYCHQTKRLLDDRQIPYEEIDIELNGISRKTLAKLTKGYSVPQIVINGKPIGGYNNLWALDQSGKLQELIKAEV